MKSTMKTLLAATALVTAFAAPAFADRGDIRALEGAKVSLVDAIKAAEKHQGGRAYEASIDDDSFQPAYEVGVIKDGRVYDVRINATDGSVVGSREDIDD